MEEACQHEFLHQLSDCVLRWTWVRQDDGSYEPEVTHDKVMHEDTIEFRCGECDELVFLDDDARLEPEEVGADA